ncbi:hypothetical protein [Laceyella tengchongensis]|uniref:hypothetical protein n=1 Tax=Laceyella tengchongensis TaxID=574699 RepID=UPI0012B8833D|nr:hypothetical protein [Laceyella tengchongensis]
MLKVQVEGQMEKVQPFLSDLKQRSQVELLENQPMDKGKSQCADVKVTCYIHHHSRRSVKTLRLETENGQVIRLPLMDLIEAEVQDGVKIFAGRSFDIFG